MFTMKFIATLASLVSLASAHGGVGYYVIDGTTYQGWQPYNSADGQKTIQRLYSSYNPLLLTDLSSVNIRCNNAGSLGTGVSASVKAGGTILAHWTQWTHRPAAALVYMAKCPAAGCNSWDGSGTVWFKVSELGLVNGTQRDGKWAGDQIVDTLEYSFKVPASLAPGDYLIRHELIALHQRLNPQLYPECAQLTVTGSGTDSPSGSYLVAFPGAYTATDPGLTLDIDAPSATTATTYSIPGPSVWPGTGSGTNPGTGGGSSPVVTPSAAPTTFVTSAAPSSSAPAACAAAKYAQCGGNSYTGCTSCASGSTCVKLNDFYSQCT